MADPLAWTVGSAVLVLLVPFGFALLASGLSRAQNATHTMATVALLYALGLLGYWAAGYGIQTHGPLFFGRSPADGVAAARFLFLAGLCAAAVVIPAGALAERWRLRSATFIGLFLAVLVYPLVARWIWGGGWLAGLAADGLGHGVVDFAGAGIIHLTGGAAALAGALTVGPRARKFRADGRPGALPGHHIPMAISGTLMVAVAWIGFVTGQSIVPNDVSPGLAVANTVLASAAALAAATLFTSWWFGAPDPSLMSNGLLAGLVSISAAPAYVSTVSAVLIGAIGGVLVVGSVSFVERTFRVDDPIGVVSTHGVCGAWGLMAVGLFANGQSGDGLNGVAGGVAGLLHGDPRQFAAQLVGVVAIAVFVFTLSYAAFVILGRTMGNRVSAESEYEGLDVTEMGAIAYPDFGPAGHDPRSG